MSKFELNNNDSVYSRVEEAANFIKSKIGDVQPEIGIICGSGLSFLGNSVQDAVVLEYDTIPYFNKKGSGVPGHDGKLVIGQLSGKTVFVMMGRFHPYEGYEPWKVSFPVRVMKLIGCSGIVITNAAGALNQNYKVGDFMIIEDHIYLPGFSGFNPLVGPNEEHFGPRFPPMADAYDRKWKEAACQVAADINEDIKKGVYLCTFGPSFETPAECRFMRMIGADAVGMSTVHEVVVARHSGMRVLALSLITNCVLTRIDQTEQPTHAEVLATSKSRSSQFAKLVTNVLKQL